MILPCIIFFNKSLKNESFIISCLATARENENRKRENRRFSTRLMIPKTYDMKDAVIEFTVNNIPLMLIILLVFIGLILFAFYAPAQNAIAYVGGGIMKQFGATSVA